MFKVKNLSGEKFGRLTVIELAGREKDGHAIWKCECECGKECLVASNCLQSGNTKSCGCFATEVTIARSTTHEMSYTKIHQTWARIKQRCTDLNFTGYEYYGGRGITVCDEWKGDFLAFYNYVSKLEHFGEEGYSLDRINVNGNYEPDYNGQEMTLKDAAKISGISYSTLFARYKRGADLFK